MLNFAEISTLKEIFGIATDGKYSTFHHLQKTVRACSDDLILISIASSPAEHEAAMVKYSRLPKKKENEKVVMTGKCSLSFTNGASLALIVKGLTLQ